MYYVWLRVFSLWICISVGTIAGYIGLGCIVLVMIGLLIVVCLLD